MTCLLASCLCLIGEPRQVNLTFLCSTILKTVRGQPRLSIIVHNDALEVADQTQSCQAAHSGLNLMRCCQELFKLAKRVTLPLANRTALIGHRQAAITNRRNSLRVFRQERDHATQHEACLSSAHMPGSCLRRALFGEYVFDRQANSRKALSAPATAPHRGAR